MKGATLTAERLRELLTYDPITGLFTWNVDRSHARAGANAGWLDRTTGYVRIGIDGGHYHAHRLALLYVNGELPGAQVDHRNGVRTDNRFANLRPATSSQNRANSPRLARNTSGVKGVCWDKWRKKWMARLQVAGQTRNLGRYISIDDAAAAYAKAANDHFGEFARTA
jgi:hypothetical protein